MTVHARPQAKFTAAALVAAGMVSAASAAGMSAHPAPPTVSVDVANAAVTDTLVGLGTGVAVVDSLIGLHVDATISLPFEASLAVLAAAERPEVAPNVLSYLVQRFVNPAVGPPIAAYPWETEQTVALFATLLPYPLGPSATDPGLVNQGRFAFADVFDSVLGQLPDPLPGYDAVKDVSNHTALGGAIVASQNIVRTPLYSAWTAGDYLGSVPAAVAANPTSGQLPGLAAGLIHAVLSPTNHAPEAGVAATTEVQSSAPVSVAKPAEKHRQATTLTVRSLLARESGTGDNDAAAVRPSGAKHRSGESLKDRLTRALSRSGDDKPAGDATD
jgi:hypothetical protein